ncbi:MAG: UvrB/UvrC motif-containing protein [Candidatus Omnitrophota bacterium]
MLCNICGKKPATVHLTEIVDDQMTELHLCEECAHQKSAQMEQQFGLSDLLAGLAEFEKPKKEAESILLKCPNCGFTYAEFQKIGRLGCSECYGAFKGYLLPLLKRIHGSNMHVGKIPLSSGKMPKREKAAAVTSDEFDLQEMRRRLQAAISAEAFEEAAKIRDQIKEMEKGQTQGRDTKEGK